MSSTIREKTDLLSAFHGAIPESWNADIPSAGKPWPELYRWVRQRTEALCEPLQTEDYVPQAALFVSPTKWHIAHTTWFFEEFFLAPHLPGYQRFHPEYAFLFNSYYQSIGERTRRDQRGSITRPGVDDVWAYRRYVDEHMITWLEKHPLPDPEASLLELGLQHEQQHQELLLTDLLFTLFQNPTYPVYSQQVMLENDPITQTGFALLDEGIYEIGYAGQGFHFDNESDRHKVYCQQARISKSLVTNGEYLEFIEAGGYADFRFWLDEGYSWVQENKSSAPLYWVKRDGEWFHFTLNGLQKLDLNAILCHVNYYEANAFAAWRGMRLPTEMEWEAAQSQFNWGLRWEWTQSAYLPYPGFTKPNGAVGEYNGKFMINQMVLRGASVATAPGHSRPSYRNFFHPQYNWQFSGIRLAAL